MNVDKPRSNAVFNKSRIFFASTEGSFSKTSLQCYPKDFPFKNGPYNANVTLPLCENTGSFVKMQLYFRRKWLLITEISFNSESWSDNKLGSLNCSKTCASTTATPGPEENSTNQLAVSLVVTSVAVIVVLLIIIFYKRQRWCGLVIGMKSGLNTSQSNQTLDDIATPPDEQCYTNNIGLEPYEEIQISQPLPYIELDKNRKETTDDANCQKLSKNGSDYVIPNNGHLRSPDMAATQDEQCYAIPNNIVTGPYEKIEISNPPPFYIELDKKRKETTDDANCEKLSKDASSDYVIPNEGHPKTHEEVAKTNSLPGYTKLDNTKRDHQVNSYQKLIDFGKQRIDMTAPGTSNQILN
ncbi:uncharacterized protein LOC114533655 [Dendronephthya gigantea]|uniref:uncharacterized protein LOC114533655 n=1 Tax=Dendronephthya gigantea TaxID=151771 RepID=UPI00106DA79A|nr:uncharacterized protein LOC114533655 [Dendronephthya gigantea]